MPQFYSVSDLASLLSIKSDKILIWIATGELKAFNVATSRNGRPRWRISAEAFEAFQAARSNVQQVKPKARRTRRQTANAPRQWIK